MEKELSNPEKSAKFLKLNSPILRSNSGEQKEFLMTSGIRLISLVLVCLLSFSMFGCGESDNSVDRFGLFDPDSLIHDAELRSKIRWELEIYDTPITAADMLKLTKLDAKFEPNRTFLAIFPAGDDLPIFNVTGLEHAENLVTLNFGSNGLTDVSPLQGLKNLKELELHYNSLLDISPLKELENLEVLWLSGNGFVNISPLTELKNLRRLSLSRTALVDVSPLTELKNLRKLWLERNELVDIRSLAGLKNLNQLHLDSNELIDISPLEGLKNLRWLLLSNNNIVDVTPLMGLKNLQELDLTDNPLSDDSKKLIIPIIEANGTKVLY
ncbi:hypothetical protein C6500_02860 [Candidatus Poribacteria bacterium]|nr:MAG: hypothetical protein C6500_02860 [Candidatus Poribacteria bacterium]